VAIVVLYGVVQRVFGASRTVIAGITANATDASDPGFLSMHYNVIDVQLGLMKLTSTYENGNILGINLLLLFPITVTVVRRWALRIPIAALGLFALVECGSRAAWVGTVTLGLVATLFFVRHLINKVIAGIGLAAAVAAFLFFVPIAQVRIVDVGAGNVMSLGGRLDPAAVLIEETVGDANVTATLVGPDDRTGRSIEEQGGGAGEMLYLAIFQIAGVLGDLVWLAPIVLSIWYMYKSRSDPLIKAVLVGLISYLVAAIAEGAFWFPPTAFNLWMLLGIGWLRIQRMRDGLRARRSVAPPANKVMTPLPARQ
jgi:hypothetical protein